MQDFSVRPLAPWDRAGHGLPIADAKIVTDDQSTHSSSIVATPRDDRAGAMAEYMRYKTFIAVAPDRRFTAVERVDSSSVLDVVSGVLILGPWPNKSRHIIFIANVTPITTRRRRRDRHRPGVHGRRATLRVTRRQRFTCTAA